MTALQLIEGLTLSPDEFKDCPLFVMIGPVSEPMHCNIEPLEDESGKPFVVVITDERLYKEDLETASAIADMSLTLMPMSMLLRLPETVKRRVASSGPIYTIEGNIVSLSETENGEHNTP
jgi:hypothetical protein